MSHLTNLTSWCRFQGLAPTASPAYFPHTVGENSVEQKDCHVLFREDEACMVPVRAESDGSKEPALSAFISTFHGVVDTKKYSDTEWSQIRDVMGGHLRVSTGYWMSDLFNDLPANFTQKQLTVFAKECGKIEQLYNKPSRYDSVSGKLFVANPSYARDWVRYFQDGVVSHRGIQSKTNCYAYVLGIPHWESNRAGFNPGELGGMSVNPADGLYPADELQKRIEADGAVRLIFPDDASADTVHAKLSKYQNAGHTVFAAFTRNDLDDYHFLAYHSKGSFRWSHKMGPGIPKIHDSEWNYRKARMGSYATLDGCFEFSRQALHRDGYFREIGWSTDPKDYAIRDARTAVLYGSGDPLRKKYVFQGYYIRENPRAECDVAQVQRSMKSLGDRCLDGFMRLMYPDRGDE
jgi:hypothetical protein